MKPQLSLRPQFRLVFREATGVMGLAAASVAVGFHWQAATSIMNSRG
jgi:hypothetical protein